METLQSLQDQTGFNAAINESISKGWLRDNGDGTYSATELGAAAVETGFGQGNDPLSQHMVKRLRQRLAGARGASLPRRLTTVAAFLALDRSSGAVLLHELRAAYRAAFRRWPSKRVALKALATAVHNGWLKRLDRGMYLVTKEGIAAEERAFARSILAPGVAATLRKRLRTGRATTLTRRFTAIGCYAAQSRESATFTLDDLRQGYEVLEQPWPWKTTAANALAKAIRRGWILRQAPGTFIVTPRGANAVAQSFATSSSANVLKRRAIDRR